jgi:hypothetical protein
MPGRNEARARNGTVAEKHATVAAIFREQNVKLPWLHCAAVSASRD